MSTIIQWNMHSMQSNKEELKILLSDLILHAFVYRRHGSKLTQISNLKTSQLTIVLEM